MAISAMSSQISSEEDRIRTWLTTLSASGRGRIHLANMFLCLRYEIIQKEQLRRFALACLSAHPSLDAEYVFHQVCRQTKGTELLFFGLASIDKNAIDKDEQLSSTVSYDVFHKYILAHKYKTAESGVALDAFELSPQIGRAAG